jgi:hypothetical protein
MKQVLPLLPCLSELDYHLKSVPQKLAGLVTPA